MTMRFCCNVRSQTQETFGAGIEAELGSKVSVDVRHTGLHLVQRLLRIITTLLLWHRSVVALRTRKRHMRRLLSARNSAGGRGKKADRIA